MPSFDIVSEIDMHEVSNAVENAQRELASRWAFRNVKASFELNEKNESIKVTSVSDFQVNQLVDILREKLAKRGIDGAVLNIPDDIVHIGRTYILDASLLQGIDSVMAKKIIKLIKESKLKVQAQIQGEQVRVTGKSRNDLQSVIALVREAERGQPFQFTNFRD
ncbi:YajQ family cyclic di-GMP-binding protein [Arsenophonus endosymbiont of Aphis craccivora]|uniref:YajQ family cyclic di-GMP-binding protein n=1 Tax=Arsenophonus endosymbiont of Aphis craccivora TaxID=1231049 RepID=UPI0015DD0E0D|nr:YajQ family cyclic di-GMP-binding protein [Arsenophonus endosymbiont of Aphis craccivora]QLK87271.1 YajQ family cyclic di-GMP-binding protein [Arsenophonus endosymbiont of Aphis craccivora]